MAKDTKQRILEAALNMFSEYGYVGTNIRELASSLNLVKSSLYRHFESKEDIWNAVLEKMSAYYDERFGTADTLPAVPQNTEELYQMTMKMVSFTVHDEKIIKIRKLLLTEQFRDEKVRKLATKHFMEHTEAIFEKVFSRMMEAKTIRKTDVRVLALSYTAPITSLIHLCDREPEMIPETIAKIEAFVRQFIEIYGVAK